MAGKATVLIVEDDVAVAEMTCEVVELAGVAAIYRTGVGEALAWLARNATGTVALISDIRLDSPMGGIELVTYVAQEWPGIAICVVSGFDRHRPPRLPEQAVFIAKPWRADELLAFVRAATRP